ncbi:unnamed protein product, partial [Darwinula stevensoni]
MSYQDDMRKRRGDSSDFHSVSMRMDAAKSEKGSHNHSHHDHSNLHGDYGNIALLYLLYILQGIPLGLAASIPMILANRGVTYKQQAEYSFVSWPFSIKLLWAPIVDSLFFARMGRRKTWLVPTQYLLGIGMLLLSYHVDDLLGEDDNPETKPRVAALTAAFFSLNFLAATQDIAVDGWALTMLKRENVGYASTCNSVGQTTGYFLGYVVFMALESAEFCNTYIRAQPADRGIITLAGFLYFWGIIFFFTTSLVWLLKHEKADDEVPKGDDVDLGIIGTYSMLMKIISLPAIRIMALFLLTCKVGFAATDSATGLKLVEAGVAKERLALLAIPLVPLQILLPLFISKYTAGPMPMSIFLKAFPVRLAFGLVFSFIVYVTPWFEIKSMDGHHFPWYYYALIIFVYALHQVAAYSMFVAVMAFYAQVSDPAVGGTYMTLLNTLTNLGGNWPSTLMLWFLDNLTWKSCSSSPDIDCYSEAGKQVQFLLCTS